MARSGMSTAQSYTPRRHMATAHIPGGGPAGAMCITCKHFKRIKTSVNGECEKATEFRTGKAVRDVSPSTAACKYFEQGTLV